MSMCFRVIINYSKNIHIFHKISLVVENKLYSKLPILLYKLVKTVEAEQLDFQYLFPHLCKMYRLPHYSATAHY